MQVSSTVEQIRNRLAAARSQADEVLARAATDAREMEGAADLQARTRIERRIGEIETLRSSIDEQSKAIEAAYVRMVESMSATSLRLLTAAREADFSAPPWPGGIPRSVELKLTETREVTMRMPIRSPGDDLGG